MAEVKCLSLKPSQAKPGLASLPAGLGHSSWTDSWEMVEKLEAIDKRDKTSVWCQVMINVKDGMEK